MKRRIYSYCLMILIFSTFIASCKKYLDAKPDKSLVIPQSVEDLQALLDNNNYMNLKSPSIGETSADNYFLNSSDINSLYANEKNAYIWDTASYSSFPNDWALCYQPVYFSNVALDNISKIERTAQNRAAWDNVKGSALFYRSRSFLKGISNWSKAYDKESANTDLGIPLRFDEDFNTPSSRANVKETYDQIISDLKEAVLLLPGTPLNLMRPSKPAGYALLARTYLSMREYDSCFKYADLCLQLKNDLIDYNALTSSDLYPIPRFNDEVIFHSRMGNFYYNLFIGRIDTLLFTSYEDNDLRKTIFFNPIGDETFKFKGSYDNSLYPFDGIVTDEVYLMRAECYARKGDIVNAMKDLNTLLASRWVANTFSPLTASSAQDALSIILSERRKELVFRDLRWMDIKRLNKEGANVTLTRIANGQSYTLLPNDNRFALPLPSDIISLTGMPQNPR